MCEMNVFVYGGYEPTHVTVEAPEVDVGSWSLLHCIFEAKFLS